MYAYIEWWTKAVIVFLRWPICWLAWWLLLCPATYWSIYPRRWPLKYTVVSSYRKNMNLTFRCPGSREMALTLNCRSPKRIWRRLRCRYTSSLHTHLGMPRNIDAMHLLRSSDFRSSAWGSDMICRDLWWILNVNFFVLVNILSFLPRYKLQSWIRSIIFDLCSRKTLPICFCFSRFAGFINNEGADIMEDSNISRISPYSDIPNRETSSEVSVVSWLSTFSLTKRNINY